MSEKQAHPITHAPTVRRPATGPSESQHLDTLPAGVSFVSHPEKGIQIHVSAGVHVEMPCRGLHWLNAESTHLEHSTEITVGANATLIYIDELSGGSDSSKDPSGNSSKSGQTARGRVHLKLEPGARATYCQVQNFGNATQFEIDQEFHLDTNAELDVLTVCVGGLKGRISSHSHCNGKGAQIRVLGAARGDGIQKFEFHLSAHHTVPDTRSAVDYLTVMADQAKAQFHGLIEITPQAMRTDATQKNRNMILSPQASVETSPKLEIATDDVRCAHGASVAPVSFDQLYYLQSRGIQAKDAELMIINGFTDPVVSKLPEHFGLRDRITQALASKHGLHPCGVDPTQEKPGDTVHSEAREIL